MNKQRETIYGLRRQLMEELISEITCSVIPRKRVLLTIFLPTSHDSISILMSPQTIGTLQTTRFKSKQSTISTPRLRE